MEYCCRAWGRPQKQRRWTPKQPFSGSDQGSWLLRSELWSLRRSSPAERTGRSPEPEEETPAIWKLTPFLLDSFLTESPRETSTHRHQVHGILRIPLKEVRGEVSIRRTGSPVTAGVPTDHREEFLIQRLQLRTKVCPRASCGGK